jgi:hypothetical protein
MFVEVLDRHGEVRSRMRIRDEAFTIGRAYDNDLIIDDPYVAAHHLRIERAEDGTLQAVDLGSRNGLHLLAPPRQVASARVVPDLKIRIGHTQLRFRDAQFAVGPELEARPAPRALRQALAFHLVLLATAALVFGDVYVSTFDQTPPAQIVASVLALLLAAFAWAGTWAFFGRLATRHANFYAHGIVALFGIAAITLVYELLGYLAFALSSDTLTALAPLALAMIVGAMVYRHLRLVSRSPARRIASVAATVTAVVSGSIWLVDYSASLTYSSALDYSPYLKAPAFRLAAAHTPAAFVDRMALLREEIDRLSAGD